MIKDPSYPEAEFHRLKMETILAEKDLRETQDELKETKRVIEEMMTEKEKATVLIDEINKEIEEVRNKFLDAQMPDHEKLYVRHAMYRELETEIEQKDKEMEEIKKLTRIREAFQDAGSMGYFEYMDLNMQIFEMKTKLKENKERTEHIKKVLKEKITQLKKEKGALEEIDIRKYKRDLKTYKEKLEKAESEKELMEKEMWNYNQKFKEEANEAKEN